jgi:hypothetical protein
LNVPPLTAAPTALPIIGAAQANGVNISATVRMVPIQLLILFHASLNQPWPEGSVNLSGLFLTQAQRLRAWEVSALGTMVSAWIKRPSRGS